MTTGSDPRPARFRKRAAERGASKEATRPKAAPTPPPPPAKVALKRDDRTQRGRPEDSPAKPRERRGLSHVGGEVRLTGDSKLGAALAAALRVSPDEEVTRRDVHGFHTYPARLHPDTAARLITELTRPGQVVLDPFSGSGTVVVEARRLGRRGIAVDANPLACELARLKVRGLDSGEGDRLLEAAERVADHATARRKGKRGATRRYPPEDVELFEMHVLLELDGLQDGIRLEPSTDVRRLLLLVLSSMLGKFSRRPADTTDEPVARRIGAGYTSKFFVKRAFELIERMSAFGEMLPDNPPPARVIDGDARELRGIDDKCVALVVTSPPYPGVYDYAAQHAARLRWLGLDSQAFDQAEIGARRRLERLPFARALGAYESDMAAVLRELARVMRPDAHAVVVVADSTLSGRAVRADRLVTKLGRAAGLDVAACASQTRPHFHGASSRAFEDAPRQEHAVLLTHVR